MRPINDREYKRMQDQQELNMQGMSDIAFICKYVDSTATPAVDLTVWLETGYSANFRLNGDIGNIQQVGPIPSGYLYAQQALVKLPMRYYTDANAFVVREAPIAAAMGKTFKLNILRSGSPFLDNGVVSCQAIRLMTTDNIKPLYFNTMDWTVVSEPKVEPDGVVLQVSGSETLRIYDWMKADYYSVAGFGGAAFMFLGPNNAYSTNADGRHAGRLRGKR